MTSSKNQPGKLPGIQVLRAVAALLVLWAHVKFAIGGSTNPLLRSNVGAIGVDIFFVISGFIISLTASKLNDNWRLFLAHRVARVVPLYYVVSTCLLLQAWWGQRISFAQVWNTYLFLPLWDFGKFTTPAHDFGWTLSFEMWFHCLFTLVFAASGARRVWIVLPGVLAVGVAAVAALYQGPWEFPRFVFHPIVLEFAAGCILFHVYSRLGLRSACLLAAAAIPLIYGAIRTQSLGRHTEVLQDSTLGFQRSLIWGGAAVCVVGIVLISDRLSWVRWPKSLSMIGDASYSLYLFQTFALSIVSKLLPAGGALAGVLFVVLSIVGSLLLYKYLEKPMSWRARRYFERRLRAEPASPLVATR